MSSEYKKEIDELQKEKDQLAKTLGKVTVERNWAVKKLKSLDLLSKKSLIDTQAQELSLSKQSNILGISRTSLYYKPKPMSAYNLQILNAMDEIYTDNPEYGYRYIIKGLLTMALPSVKIEFLNICVCLVLKLCVKSPKT